ncbi:MAG TPA: serine/threonine protein kinase [Polyangiaceae bacterium]|nr:serine/threonine protein kinase [Polyangiaceae bacterium]
MKVCPSCGLKYPDENDRCFVDKTALEHLPDERIGTLLNGRYQIIAPLGEGGMATVYRARNTLVEREVAVKVMNASLKGDAALKERFRREAKNAAAVAHPNIIEIFDQGETEDGTPFLVMEILEGEPLDVMIERGPIPAGKVAALAVQIARGLARAHDFDVIHRDLKPENIFICRDADGQLTHPKLLDFGIARSMHDPRLTSAGQVFGTPQYMAPERVTSIDAGAESDLYALGVILFEMVTGRLPFESDDLPGFFIQHMQDAPPKPSQLVPTIPRRLEELILSLLEKKPEDRPVDAHAVTNTLLALVPQNLQAPVPPVPVRASTRAPSVAPTLPPTTLERWAGRAALFEQMLQRAFPAGDAPVTQVQALAEIRTILLRTQELRAAGLKEQRKLESMEQNARDGRTRLGHAVHTLAEDLSNARTAARAANKEVEPYLSAEDAAYTAYEKAHSTLLSLGGGALFLEPSHPPAAAAREMGEALDRWYLTKGAAQKAHRWIASKQREVTDLEFQVSALRAQLERLESSYEAERASAEETLRLNGEETGRLETRMTELGGAFVAPLRERRDLGDLFVRLEREGTPAVGIRRPP